jgi:hypothetical protein
MDAPSSYAERVAYALDQCLDSGRSEDVHILASFLGNPDASDEIIDEGPKTSADETLARDTWIDVLHRYDPAGRTAFILERRMLAGLLHNDRWRTLLGCEADTTEFLIILTRCLQKDTGRLMFVSSDRAAHRALRIRVRAALSDWLPAGVAPGDFTLRDLACAFFGDAWCDFVYDNCGKDVALSQLIDTTRPEFLPGRLLPGVERLVENLPALA